MTVAEAAKAMGVSADTVYRLCADRRLSHRRVGRRQGGGRIVISESAVEEFLRACEVTPEDSSPKESSGRGGRPRGATVVREDGKPIREHWLK